MAIRRPRVPPRHLSFLFVAITVALAAALVWLGVSVVRQDRALETQRIRDGLDRVIMAAATALEQRLAEIEESLARSVAGAAPERAAGLAALGAAIGSSAVVLDFSGAEMRAAPAGILRFDPSRVVSTAHSPPVFLVAERLEFRDRDLEAAAKAYSELTTSSDAGIRAGAMVRLARTLRKQQKTAQALATYEALATVDPTDIDGVPTALLAGHARVVVLEDLARTAEARDEAARLTRRLRSGEWRLTRGMYEYYAAEFDARATHVPYAGGVDDSTVLSIAADSLYRNWPGATQTGRSVFVVHDTPVFVMWNTTGASRAAFVATAGAFREHLVRRLEPVLASEGATVSLAEEASRSTGEAILSSGLRVTRSAGQTGLPWSITVTSVDPLARSADLASRRRLLLTGLAVAVLLALVGTYAVARAVSRELAVARLKSDFVSAVSHEFRTPLTSLRQVTELLSNGRVSTEARRDQYHEVLRRETVRLQRLVENLLDFGRLEAGAHEFRFERLRANDLVEPLVNDFRQEVGAQGYDVSLRLADAGAINADREALGRAVRNLLENAVKYSPASREIDVAVGRENGWVSISVRDHGMGIPQDERGTIFGQFARGRDARASGIPGTGIGLAMVRRIVRAHGGEIRLTSSPGEGSTFTILLSPADA